MYLIMSHNHLETCFMKAAGGTPVHQWQHVYASLYLDLDLISCYAENTTMGCSRVGHQRDDLRQ